MPDFSALPEPLTLYILLELRDLKALYAAILASPHINAVFRRNARRIFETVVTRTLPAGLVSPVFWYMLLRERLATKTETITLEQMQAIIEDVVSIAATDPWPQISCRTIFHTAAEAVRIHDIAFSILRSKLDYFSTLVFEKLANPKYRYRGPYDPNYHKPEGTPINIQHPLNNPSWVEETRAIRVLWLLAAGWRASKNMITQPEDGLEGLIQPQRVLISFEDPSMIVLATELVKSMLIGPILLPPTECNRRVSRTFDVLQNYPVRHSPPILLGYPINGLPTLAQFASIPALPLNTSCEDANMWGETVFCLLGENRELLYTRVHRVRLDSPLQDSKSDAFDCLGFGFWDHRRTCLELEIRSNPMPRCEGSSFDGTRLSRSDQMFRLYKLYKQQEQREQQGWHR